MDQLLAGTLAESLSIVKQSYQGWAVAGAYLEADLAARRVADDQAFPHFPYRDDARLLTAEIRTFVQGYLALYYKSAADVARDLELRAWLDEVRDPSRGNVVTLLGIPDVASLVDLLTSIIFTCGPQHGAVNFSQWDWLGFAPNMPLALYDRFQGEKAPDILQMLPPADQARGQISAMEVLTAYHYDRFGDYPVGSFTDPAAQALARSFTQALGGVEKRIGDRNARRFCPYPWLMPSNLLNSISI